MVLPYPCNAPESAWRNWVERASVASRAVQREGGRGNHAEAQGVRGAYTAGPGRGHRKGRRCRTGDVDARRAGRAGDGPRWRPLGFGVICSLALCLYFLSASRPCAVLSLPPIAGFAHCRRIPSPSPCLSLPSAVHLLFGRGLSYIPLGASRFVAFTHRLGFCFPPFFSVCP